MSKKSSKDCAQKKRNTAVSEIIEQATIYVQSMAAYKAGFDADLTGDFNHAGSKVGQLGAKQLKKARRSLARMIGLSPAFSATASKPLSREELYAKAVVASVIARQHGSFELDEMEMAFLRFFAQEATDYLFEGAGK